MSIKINRVYTRSGDIGETGLVGGKRVPKTSLRVRAYGEADELNSVIGVAKSFCPSCCSEINGLFEFLQQELFDLGSELATPSGVEYPGMWKTEKCHVDNLERLCDKYSEGLEELPSFILPGGTPFVSFLHLARVVARRLELSVLSLQEFLKSNAEPPLNFEILRYLNRLSDLFFILCRWSLKQEDAVVPLWCQQAKRHCPN